MSRPLCDYRYRVESTETKRLRFTNTSVCIQQTQLTGKLDSRLSDPCQSGSVEDCGEIVSFAWYDRSHLASIQSIIAVKMTSGRTRAERGSKRFDGREAWARCIPLKSIRASTAGPARHSREFLYTADPIIHRLWLEKDQERYLTLF
ncbi:hypothetical protein EVAR_99580_1 [Eumeta japonica]|uniref:Uncharacterized protein n=1 Tax=Eumeta variegata TaxID=151549 RepID=A0A4C1ZM48_EUMVA|nr:hypothetical protein EVAR_99580_1 [Eumeta japonica]